MTSPRHRIANRQLGVWHRRLGLAAVAILILLAVSGVLLNHSHGLGLDRRYVQWGWLLDWYGIHAPAEPRGVALGAHWLSELDGRIYFDGRELSSARGRLNGAVVVGYTFVAAVGDNIWLLTPDGIIVEQLGTAQGVPGGLRALGVDHGGRLVAQAAQGLYTTDSELLRWRPIGPRTVIWARTTEVPPALSVELIRQYRGRGLSVERFLADLHGGRLLGDIGVWLVDLTAIACLGLALSGLWLWARRAR